jgi:hypothetical protein
VTPNDAGPDGSAGLATLQVRGQQDGEWDGRWTADDARGVGGRDVRLKNFFVSEDGGTVHAGEIVLTLGKDFDIAIAIADDGRRYSTVGHR